MLLVARSAGALRALSEELRAQGSQASWLSLDLRERVAGEKIESALIAGGQHCAVLVQAAGLAVLGPLHAADPERQMVVLDVNVRVLTELTLRFLPGMMARGCGGIVVVGSAAGYAPGPNMAVYYATKAYARSLSDALYEETRRSGVTITSVAPGYVRTPFLERSGLDNTYFRKLLPALDAAEVADAGWRAFKFGRRTVVPGALTRILVAVQAALPMPLVLWLVGALQRERN